MKNRELVRSCYYTALVLFGLLFVVSCKDDYFNRSDSSEESSGTPEWLGASIYDYLKNPKDYDGTFNYYVRIIESIQDGDVSYAEVLQKTGSKTLFVADDKAFEAFFANNPHGITRFEDLSPAQCRAILFSGMLNDTYLVEMLSSTAGAGGNPPARGQAMRHVTSWGVLDTIPFEIGSQLPQNGYWDRFVANGIHLLKDNSGYTMVSFLQPHMSAKISDEDFLIITGQARQTDDAHIFNAKIIKRDITCQNGYIHVLDRVLFPVDNLAEALRKNNDTQLFNHFLERYTVPVYDAEATAEYRKNTGGAFTDSIFVKRFFNDQEGHTFIVNPATGFRVNAVLNFDPGWNSFKASGSAITTDMATMFVPSDAALAAYWDGGEGLFLKDSYGSWDNVPDEVLSALINNHMWTSFLSTTPSRFATLEDNMGTKLGITPADIDYATICSNGVAYITNKVYPPTVYASVIAPVLTGANTKIFYKTIKDQFFDLYLASMDSKFSLLVPSDDVLNNYISPVSIGKNNPERWRFYLNPATQNLAATAYDVVTGDSVRVVGTDELTNALFDILDNHIVLGDIQDGKTFYPTKGGATIKVVSGSGAGMQLQGGANIENSAQMTVVRPPYPMKNGGTYLLDNIAQPATRSVYQVMKDTPDFSEFFNLCLKVKSYELTVGGATLNYGGSIFTNMKSIGITPNVAFFNTFNYSVYVPTNAAVRAAIAAGVIETWPDENGDGTPYEIPAGDPVWADKIQKLYNFLRYHFQDNSIYIGANPVNQRYETALLNTTTGKFRTVRAETDGSSYMNLTGEDGNTAHVIVSDNDHNIMARDYQFNSPLITSARTISTSSYAVVHKIDAVLNFQ
ncbi:hypothetical protein AGMMS49525_07560 [Bacteroidia bacterium]|nr:hypothetical protein AGMMS49525_07560 [Bacteroidia bacterium]